MVICMPKFGAGEAALLARRGKTNLITVTPQALPRTWRAEAPHVLQIHVEEKTDADRKADHATLHRRTRRLPV